jgi:hypothetical protein
VQEVQPETALERALLDREEQLERVERDLNREREARKTSIKELQKKLNAAMQVQHHDSVLWVAIQSRRHARQRSCKKRGTA